MRRAYLNSTLFRLVLIDSVDDNGTRRLRLEDVLVSRHEMAAFGPPLENLTLSYVRIRIEQPATTPQPAAPARRDEYQFSAAVRTESTTPTIRPVIRAGGGATTLATIVLRMARRYSLRGEALSRLAYARDARDSALFRRGDPPGADRKLPLRIVRVMLHEAGADPDLDPPVASALTNDNGVFEFRNGLDWGVEYILTAVWVNTDQKLQQERVTITGIRVDTAPSAGSAAPRVLRHRNHGVGGDANHVVTESEDIRASFEADATGQLTLCLEDDAALLFNTLMLDVPYINQNRNPDNSAKSTNIDGIGAVTGGILCFPTSVAMAMQYYGVATGSSTDLVATAAYRDWQGRNFPHRAGTEGLARYQFTYGNKSGGNVWEWWLWENRAARRLLNLPLSSRWHPHDNDLDGRDTLPAADGWQTHWESANVLSAEFAPLVRRHFARGWPIVLGTNLTTAGHIVIARGVVIRNDGTIHKLICNNPWGGVGRDEARALYYDNQTRTAHTALLRLANYLSIRRGMDRQSVLDNCLVHGDGEFRPAAAAVSAP